MEKIKEYSEMNEAEQAIMDALQILAYKRVNAKPSYEITDAEIILMDIAERLHLIEPRPVEKNEEGFEMPF